MKTQENKSKVYQLMPVLFAFFVMGFVDVVGISTSYVKNDFTLSDTLANLLPMMVFLWFAVCSLPTGLLMGRIGRKKTVLLSSLVTSGHAYSINILFFSDGLAGFCFAGYRKYDFAGIVESVVAGCCFERESDQYADVGAIY